MKRALFLALFAILTLNSAAPAFAKETSETVLQDFKRHQNKKTKPNKHTKKKAQNPTSTLRRKRRRLNVFLWLRSETAPYNANGCRRKPSVKSKFVR